MNTTTVNGITIPQGTTVQPDVWSLHYNSEHWGPTDPQQFDPDRLVVNKVYISCSSWRIVLYDPDHLCGCWFCCWAAIIAELLDPSRNRCRGQSLALLVEKAVNSFLVSTFVDGYIACDCGVAYCIGCWWKYRRGKDSVVLLDVLSVCLPMPGSWRYPNRNRSIHWRSFEASQPWPRLTKRQCCRR